MGLYLHMQGGGASARDRTLRRGVRVGAHPMDIYRECLFDNKVDSMVM